MTRSEKSIEQAVSRRVKKAGGVSVKMQHTGLNGFPDRQFIIPYQVLSITWYVEFKKFGEKPTLLQKSWGRKLTKLGCNYFVVNSEETLKEFYALSGI
jgi:hypothetical protein